MQWTQSRLVGVFMAPSALLASALPAHAQYYSDHGPMTWGWGWGWGHMIFGGVMMLLFWGAIVLLVVLIVRWFLGAGSQPSASKTPLDILKERFARGEIDKQEFEERKRALSD